MLFKISFSRCWLIVYTCIYTRMHACIDIFFAGLPSRVPIYVHARITRVLRKVIYTPISVIPNPLPHTHVAFYRGLCVCARAPFEGPGLGLDTQTNKPTLLVIVVRVHSLCLPPSFFSEENSSRKLTNVKA